MPVSAVESTDPYTVWKSVGGRNWVQSQHMLDRLFRPIEDLVIEAVQKEKPASVLDIGCGTGKVTHAINRRSGVCDQVTGIDISQIMIDAARTDTIKHVETTDFICADAQSYAFAGGTFDMLVSRFGVMFFDDPVKAFLNLNMAARQGANALFFAWRSAEENPFMTTAERAARSVVELPDRDFKAPGQFAFSDPEWVQAILRAACWQDITIEPINFECTMPAVQLYDYYTRLGPLGLVFQNFDDDTKAALIRVVDAAFEPFIFGNTVKFEAACWQIKARASGAG